MSLCLTWIPTLEQTLMCTTVCGLQVFLTGILWCLEIGIDSLYTSSWMKGNRWSYFVICTSPCVPILGISLNVPRGAWKGGSKLDSMPKVWNDTSSRIFLSSEVESNGRLFRGDCMVVHISVHTDVVEGIIRELGETLLMTDSSLSRQRTSVWTSLSSMLSMWGPWLFPRLLTLICQTPDTDLLSSVHDLYNWSGSKAEMWV